jgi:riboflavin synthase
MFTGLIEELGEVVAIDHLEQAVRVTVRADTVTGDAGHGDSIAVNGTCLTVVETDGVTFTADVMAETLSRTSLHGVEPGRRVNLERPLRLSDRLGGHLVQGHVDGTGEVVSRTRTPNWDIVRVSLPSDLSRYVVEKGSIAVDGVSLTVSDISDDWFEISLIPTTLASTTLGIVEPGDIVNLEVDVLAKYTEQLLSRGER